MRGVGEKTGRVNVGMGIRGVGEMIGCVKVGMEGAAGLWFGVALARSLMKRKTNATSAVRWWVVGSIVRSDCVDDLCKMRD